MSTATAAPFRQGPWTEAEEARLPLAPAGVGGLILAVAAGALWGARRLWRLWRLLRGR
jgi:hypothetical protein